MKSRKTQGIERIDARDGGGGASRVERQIAALRVPDHGEGSASSAGSVIQVACRPPLRDRREFEPEAGVLRPSDRGRVRPAEDHETSPGLVDEGERAELREGRGTDPRDRVAHPHATKTRARAD